MRKWCVATYLSDMTSNQFVGTATKRLQTSVGLQRQRPYQAQQFVVPRDDDEEVYEPIEPKPWPPNSSIARRRPLSMNKAKMFGEESGWFLDNLLPNTRYTSIDAIY